MPASRLVLVSARESAPSSHWCPASLGWSEPIGPPFVVQIAARRCVVDRDWLLAQELSSTLWSRLRRGDGDSEFLQHSQRVPAGMRRRTPSWSGLARSERYRTRGSGPPVPLCQWPYRSPRSRTREFPAGGHDYSPWRPSGSLCVFRSAASPLAGRGLFEPHALAGCLAQMRMVQQPVDRGGESLRHELVEPGRMQVGEQGELLTFS
jgi:hypothetical protein